MFIQKKFNLRQRRWLELLKFYDTSVLYNPGNPNAVADALCRVTIDSVSHHYEDKKDLSSKVHRLARLGVKLESSTDGDAIVRHNSESSLVVEVKSKQHLDLALMELKEFVIGKLKESFSLGGVC